MEAEEQVHELRKNIMYIFLYACSHLITIFCIMNALLQNERKNPCRV
jgi:hypothetical protein